MTTIEIIPDYTRMREHLLSVWTDPRQVGFREHVRQDAQMLAWLNPPTVKDPPTRRLKVLTVELAVDPDTDVEGLLDTIEQRVPGIHDLQPSESYDPVLRRVFTRPLYRRGDVFDAPLPPVQPAALDPDTLEQLREASGDR